MDARRHAYEGRDLHAPGMMRHGPFPGELRPADPRRPLEPLPPPELLENKIASQAAEIERLLRENQRLATTHVAMRDEIGANQQEIHRIKSHIGSIRTESDIQVRGLMEKIRKAEEDIRAGEIVKKELQEAHKEAQSLMTKRQELASEIQVLTEELQKISGGDKKMPELLAQLDGLRQEHQKLRATFEREKGSNIEQVEQMRAMEKNLISLAREVEKLRADVINAEKGEQLRNAAMNPYAGTFSSPASLYPPVGQGVAYGHGYAQPYVDGYGRPLVPVAGVAVGTSNVSPVDAARRGNIP
ncbi:uncharacterized protein A4U43_C05F34400 [Asparagus officinalis]|uniref:Protein FLX-like 4 n=1 Tax=Asparagus officinalis TaxID=4686 RepID=A0A5P1EWQ2_ASPOF|nr:protein FLX-like 4 [Asparagus officinalis]XP_020265820.1 protein FLX-like 4 [Asparagus officinalis]XP_020265821.1 protein FLX-like 4 [Asparagus officinalis]ONK70505.1 uncharacterized protein A4U43_C05F34400 [Asparagus officinalis]